MKNEPDCYGEWFPPLISLAHDETVAGKVFGYQSTNQGSGHQARRPPNVKLGAMYGMPDSEGCYRLSAGTALMEIGEALVRFLSI